MRTIHTPQDPPAKGLYALLTASIAPRPIAWVSSISADGVPNLAPYSFFTVACADPAILSVTSIGRKDTFRNVVETGEFVVNIGTESLMEVMNATSAPVGPEVDEFALSGLTAEPSEVVLAPRVAEEPIAFECVRHDVIDLGTSAMMLGRVVSVAISDEVLATDGLPDFDSLLPPSRLGRHHWGYAPRTRELPRPGR
ncbi:flavin reductase family protein [Dietzia psychralcaliphila]|uniref:Flavin reductase n=1 Tax=Dietzia psychralcaliphila TaxID=139021 RepID=A0AAD0JSX0_9ACTN|nr:flavin reductase family protein [Dietzia psychralcaliphila]AWH96259.1 flavin reductase [Dietzia psychralcaliphila]PTM90660.1 flavin reductase (DIM6/NTAB) family NADH-FMN oxidoreductase RutF [Dietzia psychralcaliphila]